jgi:hypothetical protein
VERHATTCCFFFENCGRRAIGVGTLVSFAQLGVLHGCRSHGLGPVLRL